MSDFNINDYIWYIVGGVALLFVVIGFVADKTGLAKKTFGKGAVSSKKKSVDNNSIDASVSSSDIVPPAINNDVSMINNFHQDMVFDSDTSQPLDITAENFVINPVVNSDEISNENADDFLLNNIEESEITTEDNVTQTESINQLDASTDDFLLNSDDSSISEEEGEDNISSVSTVDENDIETPLDSSQEIQESSVEDSDDFLLDGNINEIESSDGVSLDSEEWGTSVNDISSEEEIELPKIEDVNNDEDEDVWKF